MMCRLYFYYLFTRERRLVFNFQIHPIRPALRGRMSATLYEQMNGNTLGTVALASNVVIINVSGRRFKTDERILERYPGV